MYQSLPDTLNVDEQNLNPEMREEMKTIMKHPNPGTKADVKRATGPKIIRVPVYRERTHEDLETEKAVNESTRDIIFHGLNVFGNRAPVIKRWRNNMHGNKALRGLMAHNLSFANRNPLIQTACLVLDSYLKSLDNENEGLQGSAISAPDIRQHGVQVLPRQSQPKPSGAQVQARASQAAPRPSATREAENVFTMVPANQASSGP